MTGLRGRERRGGVRGRGRRRGGVTRGGRLGGVRGRGRRLGVGVGAGRLGLLSGHFHCIVKKGIIYIHISFSLLWLSSSHKYLYTDILILRTSFWENKALRYFIFISLAV